MIHSRFHDRRGRVSLLGRACVGLCVGLVFMLGLLVVSPGAHEFFHKEAAHGEHDCVVTSFAIGEGLYIAPTIAVQPGPGRQDKLEHSASATCWRFSARLLPPICGPPAASVT